MIQLFRDRAGSAIPIKRAVSIGCDAGVKEMQFIRQGVVEHFDLYEISSGFLEQGKSFAREWGIYDKLNFVYANAFEKYDGRKYDLVYWDSALHHMFDAESAVRWSYEALREGGWFVMTEFVGANRFQHSDEAIDLANMVRDSLDDRYFVNPVNPNQNYERHIRRLTLEEMAYDPSEAADSEAILPSVLKYFPDAFIKHIGGTIYHMGLNDVLTHIPDESPFLKMALMIDEFNDHIPHLAVGVAQKRISEAQPKNSLGSKFDIGFLNTIKRALRRL